MANNIPKRNFIINGVLLYCHYGLKSQKTQKNSDIILKSIYECGMNSYDYKQKYYDIFIIVTIKYNN